MKLVSLALEFHAPTPGVAPQFAGVRLIEQSAPREDFAFVHLLTVASAAGATLADAHAKLREHVAANPEAAWLLPHVPPLATSAQ